MSIEISQYKNSKLKLKLKQNAVTLTASTTGILCDVGYGVALSGGVGAPAEWMKDRCVNKCEDERERKREKRKRGENKKNGEVINEKRRERKRKAVCGVWSMTCCAVSDLPQPAHRNTLCGTGKVEGRKTVLVVLSIYLV